MFGVKKIFGWMLWVVENFIKVLNLNSNYHKLVSNIMTEEGANCWINHMYQSLKEVKIDKIEDKRVISCINLF